MTPTRKHLRFDLLVLASAIGFGAMPYFAVDAYAAGLTVSTLLTLRFTIAAAVIFGFLAVTRRLGRPTLRLLAVGLVLGLLYTGMSVTYFTSVQFVAPSLTTLLLYAYPSLVALTSAVLARRRPSTTVLAALALSLAGIGLAVAPGQLTLGPQAGLGISLGLACPIIYTGYVILSSRISHGLPPWEVTGVVSVVSALANLAIGAATGQLQFSVPPRGWPPVVLVALVSTVLAIGCFLAAVVVIGATRASIISTVEPVANLMIGAMFYGLALSWGQGVGTALVLAGAALAMLTGRVGARGRDTHEALG